MRGLARGVSGCPKKNPGGLMFEDGLFIRGVECRGSYCDDKLFLVCTVEDSFCQVPSQAPSQAPPQAPSTAPSDQPTKDHDRLRERKTSNT